MGRRQHYIPAASIGQFSVDRGGSELRDRRVWVQRSTGDPQLTRAAKVGFQNDLYRTETELLDVDACWTSVEAQIHVAVDHLVREISHEAQARSWIDVASYTASLFARAPNFRTDLGRRFESLLGEDVLELSGASADDNANLARTIEVQRVAAAVLRARWAFLRSDAHPLIVNDRGITPAAHRRWGSLGYVIPLRRNFAAMLGTGPFSKGLRWVNGEWAIDIPTYFLRETHAQSLNAATAAAARREYYSGDRSELVAAREGARSYADSVGSDVFDGARLLGLTPVERMNDELLLVQLLGGIRSPDDPRNPPEVMI